MKKDGVFILHIPFYFKHKTEARAVCGVTGEIEFLKEPIYHGNPLSDKGSLVFTDFGWDIFEIARKSGFQDTYMYLKNDFEKGYLNNTSFVFILKK